MARRGLFSVATFALRHEGVTPGVKPGKQRQNHKGRP
jgi:hypothetical protein